MNPEPLKYNVCINATTNGYTEEQVKSAIEWLKQEILKNIIFQRKHYSKNSMDLILYEEEFEKTLKLISKAFEDVTK